MPKMIFNKEKFIKNAPSGIRRQVGEHVDILDGLEVIFDGSFGEYGCIPQYFSNGQEYYLYPAYKSWCVMEE